MRTTTQRIRIGSFIGNTTRTDESGRKLYTIWSNGAVWINDSKTGKHELYINRIGHLFRYNKKKKEWVRVT